MKVKCRTNLDLSNEQWPTDMPAVPRIGERIQSTVDHNGFHLELEVCNVTWKYDANAWPANTRGLKGDWVPEIELHIPSNRKCSIAEFYRWYAPLVGRSVGSFI